MIMRADLYRPVACILHDQLNRLTAFIYFDVIVVKKIFAWSHSIPLNLADRIVQSYELGAIRESGLYLDLIDHLGNSVHDV